MEEEAGKRMAPGCPACCLKQPLSKDCFQNFCYLLRKTKRKLQSEKLDPKRNSSRQRKREKKQQKQEIVWS